MALSNWLRQKILVFINSPEARALFPMLGARIRQEILRKRNVSDIDAHQALISIAKGYRAPKELFEFIQSVQRPLYLLDKTFNDSWQLLPKKNNEIAQDDLLAQLQEKSGIVARREYWRELICSYPELFSEVLVTQPFDRQLILWIRLVVMAMEYYDHHAENTLLNLLWTYPELASVRDPYFYELLQARYPLKSVLGEQYSKHLASEPKSEFSILANLNLQQFYHASLSHWLKKHDVPQEQIQQMAMQEPFFAATILYASREKASPWPLPLKVTALMLANINCAYTVISWAPNMLHYLESMFLLAWQAKPVELNNPHLCFKHLLEPQEAWEPLASPAVEFAEQTSIVQQTFVATHLIPSSMLFRETQYGKHGYYRNGLVSFDTSDFVTHASNGNRLAHDFVLKMYERWLQTGKPDFFPVLEIGGGNGSLAESILMFLDEMKVSDKACFRTFAASFNYTIVEISPALAKKQRALLGDRVEVILGDACNLAGVLSEADKSETIWSYVISNEVLDEMIPELIRRDLDNRLQVKVYLPSINKELLTELFATAEHAVVVEDSDQMKLFMEEQVVDCEASEQMVLISAKHYQRILTAITRAWFYHTSLDWKPVYLPIEFFPEVEHYLKTIPSVVNEIPLGGEIHVAPDYAKFLASIKTVAPTAMTTLCDYGGQQPNVSLGLRIFGQGFKPSLRERDMLATLCFTDITHSVNFTEVQAVLDLMQQIVSYGLQRELVDPAKLDLVELVALLSGKVTAEQAGDSFKAISFCCSGQ